MNRRPIKSVLLILNDHEEARQIGEMFNDQGLYSFALNRVECMAEAEEYLKVQSVSVVLLDLYGCPDATGSEAINRVHAAGQSASIVLLIGPQDEDVAVRALEEGVQDYLVKGQIESQELMRAMRNSVARKIMEIKLFNEMNRARITLECIGDAVICTDLGGNITFLNAIAERMTGCSLMDAVGRPLTDSFRIIDAATGDIADNPTKQAFAQGPLNHLPVNCILTRRDGHQIFIEDSVAPIRDSSGVEAGSVLVFRDVTEQRTLAEQITHLAEHDSLTGLPNRLLLSDRLGQLISQESRRMSPMAVLFLDLDGFKYINDSLGHSTGDLLLQSVAKRLQGCVRAMDTVSRQGGDEFVVLLHDLQSPEYASLTATRILKSVTDPHTINGQELQITASIGISVYPDDGQDAETLVKNADTAMYQAKENGRQNFRFFKPEMNVQAVARQSMETDLRRVLDRHELSLHYQPIINIKSGSITGAEALLRWIHPTRGAVVPGVFIPVAEDSGMILAIGAWVLREACTQARAWMDAGMRPITMAVNVSALQLRNEDFLQSVTAILDETGLNSDLLDIEVTESALMERYKFGATTLKALRERGVHVAVDDFGMGFSSLSFLQNFPLDVLKIDQSFIRQISAAPFDRNIVSTIINLGQSLKLRVIAEGVESAQDLAFLKAQDCDEAQGFYFSQPVTAAKFAELRRMQVN